MTKRVRDVMVPARWTVASNCPLPEAARLMRSWDVKEVFVVDGGTLRGVLTDVDVVVLAIASGRSPARLVAGDGLPPATVRLRSDEPVPEALADLRRHGLQRAPVVDGDQLVGAAWLADLELACHLEQENGHGRDPEPDPGPGPGSGSGSDPDIGPDHEPDPDELFSSPLLTVTMSTDGRGSRLTVAGELDISTTPLFVAAVEKAFEHDVDVLTVDVDEVTFADSSAIHALVRIRAAAEARGTRLRLTNVAGSFARTLTVTGTGELFDIARS